jgi:hypothetical protein
MMEATCLVDCDVAPSIVMEATCLVDCDVAPSIMMEAIPASRETLSR